MSAARILLSLAPAFFPASSVVLLTPEEPPGDYTGHNLRGARRPGHNPPTAVAAEEFLPDCTLEEFKEADRQHNADVQAALWEDGYQARTPPSELFGVKDPALPQFMPLMLHAAVSHALVPKNFNFTAGAAADHPVVLHGGEPEAEPSPTLPIPDTRHRGLAASFQVMVVDCFGGYRIFGD